jgi:hypothetical protein
MSIDHHFPTSTRSGATAGPSGRSSARSRTGTRVRSRRRVRADTDPRASAAGPAEIAAPVTGPARAEPARATSAFDALAERIDERDRPLLAMLLGGEHPDLMAQAMGVGAQALGLRVRALVAKLGAVRNAPAPGGESPVGPQSQMAWMTRDGVPPVVCAR